MYIYALCGTEVVFLLIVVYIYSAYARRLIGCLKASSFEYMVQSPGVARFGTE